MIIFHGVNVRSGETIDVTLEDKGWDPALLGFISEITFNHKTVTSLFQPREGKAAAVTAQERLRFDNDNIVWIHGVNMLTGHYFHDGIEYHNGVTYAGVSSNQLRESLQR